MPIVYDETKDSLYLKGKKAGEEKLLKAIVINLLESGEFSLEKIAKLSNTSVDFVRSVRNKMNRSSS